VGKAQGDLFRTPPPRGCAVEECGAEACCLGRLGRLEAREACCDVRVQDCDADAAAAFDARGCRRDRERQDQKRDEPNRRVHGNALKVLYFEIRDLGPRLLGPAAQCSVEMLRAA